MRDHFPRLQALGAQVLVVTFATPQALAIFLADYPMPFPVVSDPERRAYRAFGLERTSWWTIFRPDVVLRYLRLIRKGWSPRRPGEGDDLLQLGGDFVLDAQGEILYAHRSADPTDRPTMETLFAALSKAIRSADA